MLTADRRAEGRPGHDDQLRDRRRGLRASRRSAIPSSRRWSRSSGSAYTYSYAVMGEILAWTGRLGADPRICARRQRGRGRLVGLCVGLLNRLGIHFPARLAVGPQIQWGFLQGGEVGGLVNLPAVVIVAFVTTLLVIGTKESATLQRRAGRRSR